jgi:hypothetical protein
MALPSRGRSSEDDTVPRARPCFLLLAATAAALLGPARAKASPAPRLATAVDDARRTAIAGSRPPLARPEADLGALAPETPLQGVTLVFARTPAQEAELQALIAAQQDPTTPLHRQWLTPEAFAARFGMADADLSAAAAWLRRHGLSVDGVSRTRDRLRVSGTAAQLRAAFGVELHRYAHDGAVAFGPAAEVSVPAALRGLLQGVTNLSSFRPRPHVRRAAPDPRFTSSQTGNHFLTPGDLATIYDLAPAYAAGLDGTGQAIAVVGQSAVLMGDVTRFQVAAGLPVHAPGDVLVPGSGTATRVSGDESESDLDLEYASAVARGATVSLVHVGNASNQSVWDALTYAIDQDLAPIISVSYGLCEPAISASDLAALNAVLAQAAAQGQAVIAAGGDAGSTDCDGVSGLSGTTQYALAVDFPASSPYVTALGGTEFNTADVAAGNTTYWLGATGSDGVASARSYLPERAWNDDSAGGLAAGGGGASAVWSRPGWQAGVPGLPAGTARLVPDVSLSSSAEVAGYLYCSSDKATGVSGSCANGFRDSAGVYLTVAGGTSFAAPIFAGMVAVLGQRAASTGEGVVAATLYGLAVDPAVYASAFHDVTAGSNACGGGAICSTAGASGYAAAAGYDQATGLGSIDFQALLGAWPGSAGIASRVTLSAATLEPAAGEPDALSIAVGPAAGGGTGTPTGVVGVSVDGATTATLTLSGGAATYAFSGTAGVHTIAVAYAGDATFAGSRALLTVDVGGVPAFSLSATDATVATGQSATSTVTVTPLGGYTGTIGWSVSSAPPLGAGCFALAPLALTGAEPVTATLTIDTTCAAHGIAAGRSSAPPSRPGGPGRGGAPLAPWAGLALALVAAAVPRWRRTRLPGMALALLLGAALLACGGGGGSPSAKVARGTYTVTVVGADTVSSSLTAATTLRLVVE